MAFTTYFQKALANHVFGGVSYSPVATVYIGLFVGATEVSGGSYVRQAVTVSTGLTVNNTTGVVTNAVKISFPTSTASWGTITQFKMYDGTGGSENILLSGSLTTPTLVGDNYVFSFEIGELSIQF